MAIGTLRPEGRITERALDDQLRRGACGRAQHRLVAGPTEGDHVAAAATAAAHCGGRAAGRGDRSATCIRCRRICRLAELLQRSQGMRFGFLVASLSVVVVVVVVAVSCWEGERDEKLIRVLIKKRLDIA